MNVEKGVKKKTVGGKTGLHRIRQRSMRLSVAAFAASVTFHSQCFTQAFSFASKMSVQRTPNHSQGSRLSVSSTIFHDNPDYRYRSVFMLQQRPYQDCLRRGHHHRRCRRRTISSMSTPRRVTALRMVFDPDFTPVALNLFHKWLGSQKNSNLKIGDQIALAGRSPLDGGRGLMATKPIQNGKTVLTIPQSLALTATGLGRSGIARYVKGFEGWTGDTGLIALQLLWERAQGDKSPIAPWIAVLPAPGELDMPLFWDEEDLALADASSTRGMSGFSADVDEDYAWLAQNTFGANPTVFPEDKFGSADFRWAVGVALSRSFFVDGELRLTPLVDFANHASSRSMLEPIGGMTGLLGSKAVVLRAGKDYEEGEEFFVSYGPKGAAAYLEENGFVPPLSGAELTCELEFSIGQDDRFFDDKEDILQSQGLGTSTTFELTSVGLPDVELTKFLRLSMINGEDAFLLEGIFRNEIWGFVAEPISKTNEAAVNNALASRCRAELEGFHGTSDEEEDILAGKREATHRQRLCAAVRRGERLALKMTASWCDTDSKALDRKEYYQERRLKELQLDLPFEVDEVYPLDQQAGRVRRDMDW